MMLHLQEWMEILDCQSVNNYNRPTCPAAWKLERKD